MWQDLKDLFRKCGDVIRADVMERDGRSKGCGTVLFSSIRDADEAICNLFNYEFHSVTYIPSFFVARYDGYDWNGRRIEVREVLSLFIFVHR